MTRRRWVTVLASWQRGKRLLIAAMANLFPSRIFLLSPQFKVRCQLAKLPEPIRRHREFVLIELARQRHRQASIRLSEAIERLRLAFHGIEDAS